MIIKSACIHRLINSFCLEVIFNCVQINHLNALASLCLIYLGLLDLGSTPFCIVNLIEINDNVINGLFGDAFSPLGYFVS